MREFSPEQLDPLFRDWTRQTRLPQIEEEVKRRTLYRALIERTPGTQAAELARCAADPVHWFNQWVWTFDPRMAYGLPATLPFTLRPKQVELIHWLQERERTQTGGLIEKARDEGMSYVILGYFLHHWLFVDGFTAGVGSRKEEYVDKKGDPKTLLHKFRDMLYKLPPWMLPEGFGKDHDNFMRIVNPARGSSISGEAGDNIGRGGRTSIYLLDEWAYQQHQGSIDAAISQNTNVVLKGSTPNGVGEAFYNDRFSGRYPVFTMPWRDNPDKNWTAEVDGKVIHPWYEKQRATLDPVVLAQEVDLDYAASVEGIVIPAKWVQAAFDYVGVPDIPVTAGVDVADEGADKSAYAARAGVVVLPSIRQMKGLHIPSELKAIAKADGVSLMQYDKLGVGASITATLAKEENLPFRIHGIANSFSPTHTVYPDAEAMANQRFYNLAAELWWRLRLRFKATYEVTHGLKEHPADELISLAELRGHPLENAVKAQLSQATYKRVGTGDKISVDKKGNGTKSPDLAEVIMYAFAPPPPEPTESDVPGSASYPYGSTGTMY